MVVLVACVLINEWIGIEDWSANEVGKGWGDCLNLCESRINA